MNAEQLDRLRGQMQRRVDRLRAVESPGFFHLLERFYTFLQNEPTLTGICQELGLKYPHAYGIANFLLNQRLETNLHKSETDIEQAALCYGILEKVVKNEDWFEKIRRNVYPWSLDGATAMSGGKLNTSFVKVVIEPLCDVISEVLDEQQIVMGLLVRYKKRCEWFTRDSLMKTAATEDEKNYAQVEKALKQDLHCYLHDQGLSFHIEPASVQGEIDLIIGDGPGSYYVEGKVFDSANRNKAYIKKGFGQMLTYLDQYNAATGYLVVFKTCEERLSFGVPNDCVDHNGKRIHLVVIDLHDHPQPVSQRSVRNITISREELVG